MALAEICLTTKNGLRHIVLGNDLVYPRIFYSEFLANLSAGRNQRLTSVSFQWMQTDLFL